MPKLLKSAPSAAAATTSTSRDAAASRGLGVHFEWVDEAFGAGQQRRHPAFDLFDALVTFAFGADQIAVDSEFADSGDLRDAEEFGDFGTDLPGFGVEGVFAKQNEVEMLTLEPCGEGAGSGERVGTGEGAILQMHGAVHTHRERVGEGLAGLRRTHREGDSLGAETIFEIDRLGDRAQIVGADNVNAVAANRTRDGIEIGVFDQGNLLDTGGDFQHCKHLAKGTLIKACRGCKPCHAGRWRLR